MLLRNAVTHVVADRRPVKMKTKAVNRGKMFERSFIASIDGDNVVPTHAACHPTQTIAGRVVMQFYGETRKRK